MVRRSMMHKLRIAALVVMALVLFQAVVIALSGGFVEWRLANGGQIGCDGVSVRYVWTPDGRSSVAWDDLSGWPRWTNKSYMKNMEFPLWIPLSGGMILFLGAWLGERIQLGRAR